MARNPVLPEATPQGALAGNIPLWSSNWPSPIRWTISCAATLTSPCAWSSRRRKLWWSRKLHAHKDYLARTCTPTGFSDLVEHSLIGFDRETPAIRGMRSRVPGADALRFSFRADSDIAQLRAIKAGFGIGICQVGLAKQNPDLVRLLPEAFELKLGVWLAMHENLRATPPLPRCIRWLGGQPCRIFEPVSGERRANSKPRQRLHRRMPYQNFMILERGENAKSQSIAAMSVFCPKTSTVAIGSDPFYVDPGRVRHVAFAQTAVIHGPRGERVKSTEAV
jgi:LysR substrate binding domain